MKTFGSYANYYDLIYADKDYGKEVDFVLNLIRAHAARPRRLLELGCGTGIHTALLAEKGYDACGIDLSRNMLVVARDRARGLPAEVAAKMNFFHADTRDFHLNEEFDAVLSLFHVMSYQISNDDLLAAMRNAKRHLSRNGVFIFDCWYGPAVLTDRPTVRTKKAANADVSIVRRAEPTMDPNRNLVSVHFQITVTRNVGGASEQFAETHQMRYLFMPEVDMLLKSAGLRMLECGEWLTRRPPDFSTWYVYFVAAHDV